VATFSVWVAHFDDAHRPVFHEPERITEYSSDFAWPAARDNGSNIGR
jgi:hypothetical protein